MGIEKNIPPSEPKGKIFYYVYEGYEKILPLKIRKAVNVILWGIAPEVPIFLGTILKNLQYRKVIIWTWVIAFCFCFGGTIAITYCNGVLFGSDHNRIYFLNDKVNLINYSLLCPTYLALMFGLMAVVVGNKDEWENFSDSIYLADKTSKYRGLAIPATVFFALAVAFYTILNFTNELFSTKIYPKQYWFIERTNSLGERILGTIGVYYSFLNLVFCFFSVLTIIVYFRVFISGIKIGRALRQIENNTYTLTQLRLHLASFSKAYIIGKMIVCILMINAFIWKNANMGSFNRTLLGLVMTFFGVFFVSIPRYYIEMQWHQLKVRSTQLGNTEEVELDDVRPGYVKLISYIVDVFIIGSFILSYWFENLFTF